MKMNKKPLYRRVAIALHYFGLVLALALAGWLFCSPIYNCCVLFDAGLLTATKVFTTVARCLFIPAPAFFIVFLISKFIAESIERAGFKKRRDAE